MTDAHYWYPRPVFFVADVNRAVCQVNHGECEIILSAEGEHQGCGRLFIELTAAGYDTLRRELLERSVPTQEIFWGYPTIRVEDPDGNELFFPDPTAPQPK